MFKLKIIITLLLVCTFGLQAQEWHHLKSEKGKFTINFPAEPQFMTEQPSEMNKHHEILVYLYEMKDKEISYYAAVTFWTEKIENNKNFLNDIAEEYQARWDGIIDNRLELNIDGNLGYELDLTLKIGSNMRARIFYKDGKLYELVVVCDKEKMNTSDVNDYMNSFNIE